MDRSVCASHQHILCTHHITTSHIAWAHHMGTSQKQISLSGCLGVHLCSSQKISEVHRDEARGCRGTQSGEEHPFWSTAIPVQFLFPWPNQEWNPSGADSGNQWGDREVARGYPCVFYSPRHPGLLVLDVPNSSFQKHVNEMRGGKLEYTI